jgi:hypothetical protein
LDSTTGIIVVGGPYSNTTICESHAVDISPTTRFGTLNWQGQWLCQAQQPGQSTSSTSGVADVVIELDSGGGFEGWQQTYHTFPNSMACLAYGSCANPVGVYNRWQFWATGTQYCLPSTYPSVKAPCPPQYGDNGQPLVGQSFPARSTKDVLVATHDSLSDCVASVDATLQNQAALSGALVALDAGQHSGISDRGVKLELARGEYIAEVLATDAVWIDKYHAPVRLQYQGKTGRKLVTFAEQRQFTCPLAAKHAYEGQLVRFVHEGGKLTLYLTNQKMPGLGRVLLRVRKSSDNTMPSTCLVPAVQLSDLVDRLHAGNGTGYTLTIDHQDFLLLEFETPRCGLALILWPTFDWASLVGLPDSGEVSLRRDLHASEAVQVALAAGSYLRKYGNPNRALDVMVPLL